MYLIFIIARNKNVLGLHTAPQINPLTQDELTFPNNETYKYFYELNQNTTRFDTPFSSDARVHINSDLLNEHSDYTPEKPHGAFRIITLGDSWTLGYGVHTEENYSEILENMLNSNMKCSNFNTFEVINFGVYGYDIAYSVERYRIRGKKYNPDMIIFHVKDNNFALSTEKFRDKTEEYKKEIIPNGQDAKDSLTSQIATHAYKELYENKDMRNKTIEYERIALNGLAQNFKNTLVFHGMTLSPEELSILESYKKKHENVFIDYWDYTLSKDEEIPGDGHPNKKGHRKIAEELYNYIRENKIIHCDNAEQQKEN